MSRTISHPVLLFHGFIFLALCTAASSLGVASMPSNRHPPLRQQQQETRLMLEAASTEVLLQDSQRHYAGKTETASLIWLLGIPISLVGSTLTVSGLMLQKIAHEADKEPRAFYCLNWEWLGGFALFVSGNVITWSALGMAPSSVLSCFNSWNIIFTFIIVPRWFKNEVITTRTKWCAAVLVIGCCWVATAGPRSYRIEKTLPNVNRLFEYPAFKVCSVCLAMVYLTSVLRYKSVRLQAVWNPVTVAHVAVAASVSASYAVMFSKCTSMLVETSVESHHNEVHHQFYVYLILTFFCGVSQIHFLNESVRHGAASFVVPIYESTAMAIQIVVGGMLFQEYVDFTWQHHFCFWPGVVLVLGGVVALTKFAEEDRVAANARD